jgi:hypothetical protein
MRIAQVAPLYESVPPQLYGGTATHGAAQTRAFRRAIAGCLARHRLT